MAALQHDAFISYARRDDDYGRITELRKVLEQLISKRLGRPATIFQDKEGIRLGQQWEAALRCALNCACFIPIITANYLDSDLCSDEVLRFATIEAEQQVGERIMPLYYDRVGAMERVLGRKTLYVKPYAGDQQRAFEILKHRQVKEVHWFREAEPESLLKVPALAALLENIAKDIAGVIERTPAELRPLEPRRKTRPASLIVVPPDQSLEQAVHDAEPGSRIVVQGPAEHRASIVIDKALQLVADGGPVTLIGAGGPAITCSGGAVRVAGMSIRGTDHNAVLIVGGHMLLEGCDVGPSRYSAVLVRDGAEAALLICTLHDAQHCGAHVQLSGNCLIVDCRIRNNQVGGLFFSENASGIAEANIIEQNGVNGIFIAAGANPVIRRNEVRDHQCGILVYLHWPEYGPGRGLIEDNVISQSRQFGIQIEQGADPCVRNNTISGNAWGGVWTRDGGRGLILGNRITRNIGSGIKNDGGHPRIGENTIEENGGRDVEDVTGGAVRDRSLASPG